jgi:hypothetical protein
VLVAAVYIDQSRRAAALRGAKTGNPLLAMLKTSTPKTGTAKTRK